MIKIGETAAKVYVGDMHPVNIYKGDTKVAGWHPQTVSGEDTISLDGAYNVPPDALVIDGKCQQTVGVWGTNLITNGDFSNGTTGWDEYDAALSAANNILTCVGTGWANFAGATSLTMSVTAGHKYYVSARLSCSVAGKTLQVRLF